MKMVFLGTETDIGGYPALRNFGQVIELPDQLAKEAVLGGAALIPVDQFDAVGFTEQELRKFATPGARRQATEEFAHKQHAALLALHEYREGLEKEEADRLAAAEVPMLTEGENLNGLDQ